MTPEEGVQRHVSAWLKWVSIEASLSYIESRLIELSQREMTEDEMDRLARILQEAQRRVVSRVRRRAA